MNDKDKEAFDNWKEFNIKSIVGLSEDAAREKLSCVMTPEGVWQAACEYKQKEYSNLMDAMTQTSQYNYKLQAENKKLREALLECPIVGEIHRDSNDRFKEWNLIHRNTIREALKEGKK